MDGIDNDHDGSEDKSPAGEKPKRLYRACLHCRSRKAKCDLGDVDSPSEPPCSRCRRESRECVFAPSRRGGNGKNLRRRSEAPTTTTTALMTTAPSWSGLSDNSFQPQPLLPQTHFDLPLIQTPHHSESSAPAFNLWSNAPSLPPGSSSSPFPFDTAQRSHSRSQTQQIDHTHNLVSGDLQNEADAIEILSRGEQGRLPAPDPGMNGKTGKMVGLEEFVLVKQGILSVDQLVQLSRNFFLRHHHYYPMVPLSSIPHTLHALEIFAVKERHLLVAIVIIASRNDRGMREVHDRCWSMFRGWISDILLLGTSPTIGLVEGLLLLSENLPRDPSRDIERVHGSENRQAWMLIGTALRCAYGLGLEKIAFEIIGDVERTKELERARQTWTFCYIFDRHISLRLGMAFWSRGPSICFEGFSSTSQTGPPAGARNFPLLCESPAEGLEPQEDLASLLQAYVELTQMMTNAQSCLYPNAERTKSIVTHGEYFKYLDELARSLDSFKRLWGDKRWTISPLTDTLWAMFYYTELYICGFSFQAHVERANKRAETENDYPPNLFPHGAAASPDARYIFQSCTAARKLLQICVHSLSPSGELPFLPNRYLLWFTYGAIVLLKAIYSGAMLREDHAESLNLIDSLCKCLSTASHDETHSAVRYGRQLEDLRRKLAERDKHLSANAVSGIPNRRSRPASPIWNFPDAPAQTEDVSFAYDSPALSMRTVTHQHQGPPSDPFATTAQVRSQDMGLEWMDDPVMQAGGDALDLQDFWLHVAPGEAQGGFPFR